MLIYRFSYILSFIWHLLFCHLYYLKDLLSSDLLFFKQILFVSNTESSELAFFKFVQFESMEWIMGGGCMWGATITEKLSDRFDSTEN